MGTREKLVQIITNLFGSAEAKDKMSVLAQLERGGVKRFEVLLKKLLQATDREAFDDLFTEALVARVFLRNRFGVAFLKPPKPDMEAEANHSLVFIEVKRVREDAKAAEELEKKMRRAAREDKLVEYGNVEAGAGKVLAVVQDAIPQLVEGETNLVFVWAEKSDWEEWEFFQAMKYVEEEISSEHEKYASLSGLIYRTRWLRLPDRRQFYFWKHPYGTMIDPQLNRRLENLR